MTDTSDEPIALTIGMAVAPTRPGTIRNPPPMPKKPEAKPTSKPDAGEKRQKPRRAVAVRRTSGSPPPRRGLSIVSPTTIMSTPNSASSLLAVDGLADGSAQPPRPITPARRRPGRMAI